MGRSRVFVDILGFVALGLESTLPIPQLWWYVANYIALLAPGSDPPAIINKNLYMDFGRRLYWVGWEVIHSSRQAILSLVLQTNLAVSRTIYFFLQRSPLQFKVCAIFQLSVDCGTSYALQYASFLMHVEAIVVQRIVYGNAQPASTLPVDDELALEER